MVRILKVLTVFLCVILSSKNAVSQTNDMAVEVARDHIDVTVGFTGSSIELFGDKKDKDAHLAIVVEGPRKDITIWQKERVLGAWMNSKYTKFHNIPVYYQYAFSDDENAEKYQQLLNENEIGHKALIKKAKVKRSKSIKNQEVFVNALLDKKKDAELYFEEPSKVNFINDNFFRVKFKIPPSAATGEYTIKSYLIKNGKVMQTQEKKLVVDQVGLNAFVRSSAHDYSFIYAMICIIFGVTSGWFVSVLKVKP